jgi:hypothetical protein
VGRTVQEELYFACEQVLACSRQGNNYKPADKDEIIISYAVFKMVIAALKRADDARSTEC